MDFLQTNGIFKFSVGALQSIVKIFQIIKTDINSNTRLKNDLIHKNLVFTLFKNKYDVSNEILKTIFPVSDYFLSKAREHISEMKKGNCKN